MKTITKLGLTSICLFLTYDYNTKEQVIIRNYRTAMCGLRLLYNYKIKFCAENINEIHEFTAKDIYEVCTQNDGLYVKFGQGLASFDHMLPPQFYKHLSKLQDKARAHSLNDISEVFYQDIGSNPNDIFEYFEEEPVASASLAQVHKARLKTGEEVAVKIQKPNIRKQFWADMAMHRIICNVIEYAFELPITPFVDNIEYNLEKEIDFRIEASNTEICRNNFNAVNRNDVYLPKIYEQFTSKRVMVTEWIDGCKITDQDQIKQWGFSYEKIANTIISAFAEQIFISGFVHCDPHPGNILLRKNPQNKQKYQVVILDFGLCIEESNNFREQYCRFWKSIFLQDMESMKTITHQWGIKNHEMFASNTLMKPYNSKKPVQIREMSQQDVMEMQLKLKNDVKNLMYDAHKLPKEIVFLGKMSEFIKGRNMNLVRAINKSYGSIVNRVNVMAKYAVKGLADIDNNKSYYKVLSEVIWFQFMIILSTMTYKIAQIWTQFRYKKGIEEIVEDSIYQEMRQKFEAYGMKPPNENTFDA